MKILSIGGVVVAASLFVLSNSVFVVNQTEQALILQFGNPVKQIKEPGLNFKVPFTQNVEYFDNRLLDFDAQSNEVIAADQKRLIVDAFVRYRITDPLQFKRTVGDEMTMRSRLNSILESSLRQVLGGVPLSAVLSEKRSEIMADILNLVNLQAVGIKVEGGADNIAKAGFGIEVVDVRIKRADLPTANSEGIYKRMQTEREREAKEFRAKGSEEAQKIRSQANKERTILLAQAKKKAEITRGEGDGTSTKIFADAFGKDQDFFQFYRSMQAYKKTLSQDDTTMMLSPDNEFLKFMGKE
ncbi:MAG: protease modulator HflC [Rickettsiales bacterium]|jgi:membrane protease subunit HflC